MKWNPVRGILKVVWQNPGDAATHYRLFKLEDDWD